MRTKAARTLGADSNSSEAPAQQARRAAGTWIVMVLAATLSSLRKASRTAMGATRFPAHRAAGFIREPIFHRLDEGVVAKP
jgi:hypothetical protein